MVLPGNGNIQFGRNTVTKTSSPDKMRIEVEKFIRAFEIGKSCGLFYVPEVLDYDEAKGVAVFERIHKFYPMANVFRNAKHANSIMEQIGSSLAIIHESLTLPDDMVIELPSEFRLSGTDVFIHGDFTGMNVGIVQDQTSIVILDWQMTYIHGGEATYGSRFFDLVWFVNYLLWQPQFNYLVQDPIKHLVKPFIQAYYKETEFIYDAETFMQYCRNFFETKLPGRKQYNSRRDRYLFPFCHALSRRFVKSILLIHQDMI
jgi:tRNA A-37 threonylcarbamoyl transferase component Bud32